MNQRSNKDCSRRSIFRN